MEKQFKEGGRYLVKDKDAQYYTILELTILEVSKKAVKVKFDNENSQWYLKDKFPYLFIEELPNSKQTIQNESHKTQFDDDWYEKDEPQFTLKLTEENDIEVNSKLEWESNPREKLMTWYDAMEYARTLSEGWRLPTKEELIDAYDNNVRGFHPDYYWSSSTYAQATSNAWGVDFYSGSVTSLYKTLSGVCVRCVRDSKT